jgi:hypothetical protein
MISLHQMWMNFANTPHGFWWWFFVVAFVVFFFGGILQKLEK